MQCNKLNSQTLYPSEKYIKGEGARETLMSVYCHNDVLHKVAHFHDSLNLLVCDGASLLPPVLLSGSFLVSDVQFFHFIFCHFEPKRGAPQLNVAQTPDKCCAQDEYALFIQRIMSAVAVVFRRVHLLLNNAAH